jgi:Na+(H+)/acetate symporter ActP
MSQSVDKLNETVSKLLVERLQKYSKKDLNDQTCVQIYQEIFLSIQEVVLEIPTIAKDITHDCVNYIAQAFYDLTEINHTQELNPNIFDKRVRANELSNRDLLFASMFLKGTQIMPEIIVTLKKRS